MLHFAQHIYVHMFSASVSVFKLCYSGPASHNPRTCIRTSEELHQAFQDLPHTIWNVEQELVQKNPQFELWWRPSSHEICWVNGRDKQTQSHVYWVRLTLQRDLSVLFRKCSLCWITSHSWGWSGSHGLYFKVCIRLGGWKLWCISFVWLYISSCISLLEIVNNLIKHCHHIMGQCHAYFNHCHTQS